MTRKALIETILTEYSRDGLSTLQALQAAMESITDDVRTSLPEMADCMEEVVEALETVIDAAEGGNAAPKARPVEDRAHDPVE